MSIMLFIIIAVVIFFLIALFAGIGIVIYLIGNKKKDEKRNKDEL